MRFERQLARRYCQTFSTGFNSGEREGRRISVMFFGTSSLSVVCQPARSRRRTACEPGLYGPADLVDMGLHGLGICKGHGERRADTAGRADGTEQVGAIVALVSRLARAGATPGPLPDDPVLLSDPGFVQEPDLDPFALGDVGEMGLQSRREVFLNASMVLAFWLGWRGRALTWEKPICFRSLPIVRS